MARVPYRAILDLTNLSHGFSLVHRAILELAKKQKKNKQKRAKNRYL